MNLPIRMKLADALRKNTRFGEVVGGGAGEDVRCHSNRELSPQLQLREDVVRCAKHLTTITYSDFSAPTLSFPRCSLRIAFRLSLILLPSRARTFTRIWSPSFNSSRTFLIRLSEISLMWRSPSVPGKISTKAPKSAILTTLPRYVLPTSATAAISLTICSARAAEVPSEAKMLTVPSSETSILTPV